MNSPEQQYRRITRRKGACSSCRQKKTRCDGKHPCSQCSKSARDCFYTTTAQDNAAKAAERNARLSLSTTNLTDLDSGIELAGGTDSDGGSCNHLSDSGILINPSHQGSMEPFFSPATNFGMPWSNHGSRSGSVSTAPLDFSGEKSWSLTWKDNLCNDFSTLAPISQLAKNIQDPARHENIQQLGARLKAKAKSLLDGPSPHFAWPELKPETDTSHLYNPSLVSCCLDAYFGLTPDLECYLTRTEVQTHLNQMLNSSQASFETNGLVNAVLAVGHARYIQSNGNRAPPASHSSNTMMYFTIALQYQDELARGSPSLLKAQALVTMLDFSSAHLDNDLTRRLLLSAVYHLQALQSNDIASPSTAWNSETSQKSLAQMFLKVFSIEKPFAAAFGLRSVIDDDWLTPEIIRNCYPVAPPTLNSSPELIQFRLARLMSFVVKALYSQGAATKSQRELMIVIGRLQASVLSWKSTAPPEIAAAINGDIPDAEMDDNSARQTTVALQYWEVVLAIHRWAIMTPSRTDDTQQRELSRQECLMAAKRILQMTRCFGAQNRSATKALIRLALVATIVIFIDVTASQDPTSSKKEMAYLAIGGGFFGHLATIHDNAVFEDVDELIACARILQQPETAPPLPPALDPFATTVGFDPTLVTPPAHGIPTQLLTPSDSNSGFLPGAPGEQSMDMDLDIENFLLNPDAF